MSFTVTKDLSQVINVQSRHEYGAIFSNPDLFLSLFLKTLSSYCYSETDRNIKRKENVVVFSGEKWEFKNLSKTAEFIRCLFEKGFKESGRASFFQYESLRTAYICEETDTIDVDSPVESGCFYRAVQPALKKLAKAVGAVYTHSQCERTIIVSTSTTETAAVNKYEFTWGKKERLVYPIPPAMLPRSNSLAKALYTMQANGTLADFTIFGADNFQISVHRPVLQLYASSTLEHPNFPYLSGQVLTEFVQKLYRGRVKAVLPSPICDAFLNVRKRFQWASVSFTIDISAALKEQNSAAFLMDPDHFIARFCLAIHDKAKNNSMFQISREGDCLTICGRPNELNRFHEIMEQIRQPLLQGYAEKSAISIVALDRYGQSYMFCRHSSNAFQYYREGKLSHYNDLDSKHFNDCIKPALQEFIAAIGGFYNESQFSQSVTDYNNKSGGISTTIKTAWGFTVRFDSYVEIPTSTRPIDQDMQIALYQQRATGDFALVGNDAKEVKLHACVLYANGGEAFQGLLRSQMNECAKKTIYFEDFSEETLQLFVDYLYLRRDVMDSLIERSIDAYSLLQFAHQWQVPGLVALCTNYLSLVSDAEDKEDVANLENLYDDPHLKELRKHLEGLSI